MNYTNTSEDASATIVCNDTKHVLVVASCNAEGIWEPNPSELCLNNIGRVCVCVCVFVCVCVCVCIGPDSAAVHSVWIIDSGGGGGWVGAGSQPYHRK